MVHRGGPWNWGPCFVYVPQRLLSVPQLSTVIIKITVDKELMMAQFALNLKKKKIANRKEATHNGNEVRRFS